MKDFVFRFSNSDSASEFTGERFMPGLNGQIQYEHFHRYLFAAPFCFGKDVLDIASGEGYGSALLAQSARSVVGVDIDEPSVNSAIQRYNNIENLRFFTGRAIEIPLPKSSVDLVTSFETLEHFSEHEEFLLELRRVLRPNGLFVVSTPNRPLYSPSGSAPNPFHVRELDRAEFSAYLGGGFKHVLILGQKSITGSWLSVDQEPTDHAIKCWVEKDASVFEGKSSLDDPLYFIGLASDGPLPNVDSSLLDCSLSAVRYERVLNDRVINLAVENVRLTKAAMEENAQVQSRDVEITQLKTEILSRDRDNARLRFELAAQIAELSVQPALNVETVPFSTKDEVIEQPKIWAGFGRFFRSRRPSKPSTVDSDEFRHSGHDSQIAFQPYRIGNSLEEQMSSVVPLSTPPTVRPAVLFVDACVPEPRHDSGSIDAVWFMRMFLAWNFSVTFIPMFEFEDNTSRTDALRAWGVDVRLGQDFKHAGATIAEAALSANLIILSRYMVARASISHLRRVAPNAKIIFNTVDLHGVREEREALLKESPDALDSAFLTKRDEMMLTARSDATIVVSGVEADLLQGWVPHGNIHHIPIPRLPCPSEVPFDGRHGVVFIGGFDHSPNVDAVKFLVNDIWPLARPRLPGVTLRIAGSNPKAEILALDSPEDRVSVVGYVEDLESFFEGARLSVAPLRYGAGVKGKVVSSLMHGLPCVVSAVANEGIHLVDGEETLECGTPAEYAEAIVRLHEDPELWHRLAQAGQSAVSTRHSVSLVAEKMAALLNTIGMAHLTKPIAANAFAAI